MKAAVVSASLPKRPWKDRIPRANLRGGFRHRALEIGRLDQRGIGQTDARASLHLFASLLKSVDEHKINSAVCPLFECCRFCAPTAKLDARRHSDNLRASFGCKQSGRRVVAIGDGARE